MDNNTFRPDFLFEVSWEICNKVGGIYTVLATKSEKLYEIFGDTQIYIGPDVWMETTHTPNFKEDACLYKSWVDLAHEEGLMFRIGRWDVPGNPVVILVNFTQYFSERNHIFAEYWEKYKLDSISGQWDYIEPVMFGYAAARVIESFYKYNISASDNIEAHFHEWMSGMGVIYLKDKLPQVSTIFTTHATMVGRCIAGNGMSLYKDMSSINADEISNRFNIKAKYSVEKLSILLSDVFTAVSELTSKECEAFYGRRADITLPNGFMRNHVKSFDDCCKLRISARKVILNVAKAMFDKTFDDNTTILMTSGRYEYRNKGIDMYIESLGDLNKSSLDKDIIALICVPANVVSPVKALQDKLSGMATDGNIDKYLTHYIYNPESDTVINSCKQNGLTNDSTSKVKVIFVPVYLNGDDGIFNMDYYDLLPGVDLSVFASYYEPYGYTPLESIAFGVPTVTSSLSGFGKYVEGIANIPEDGVMVLNRDDDNYRDAMLNLVSYILQYISFGADKKDIIRGKAYKLSDNFLWDKLIGNYFDAYALAHSVSAERVDQYKDKKQDIRIKSKNIIVSSSPLWRKVFVKQSFSSILQPLHELGMNLWWSWNFEAESLFESINPNLWEENEHNPIAMLESLSDGDLKKIEEDSAFREKLEMVYACFKEYMSRKDSKKPSIAYFSMEYGIHNSLKIFSGGLGMLAGDYLKEMSDSNIDVVGIGLLYRYGFFKQSLSPAGDQIVTDIPQRFTHLPIVPVRDENGEWIQVQIALPARNMTAKVWRADVGRVMLYLLDTDVDGNWDVDRTVTYHLYGGDMENRLKQELLLGIGGIRLLRLMNLYPTIYHLNEGHAAFAGLERLRELVEKKKFMFDEAMEIVRASTLFTTHTPVPAGHDAFSEDLIRTYLPNYPDLLNCSWDRMVNLGKFHPNANEKFSMSVLAINTAQEVNGVSKIHGDVTRDMFLDLYKGYYKDELFMDYVTNGVHYPTWVSKYWLSLHEKYFGAEFINDQMNPEYWKKIYNVPDTEIWSIRQNLRKILIDTLKKRLDVEMTERQENPKTILKTINTLGCDKLTIGFARRFATYKRAHLLFQNLDRLNAIVNSQTMPVQFIFSGKAHPADKAGQDLIKSIIEISRRPEFVGKIVFVENYDMEIAKKLVQGVDIWLNTPTRPLEASGTSGEKATMNGVLNLSVLDGWWAEGYKEGAGWALPQQRTYSNQVYQDVLDSETIYNLLENEICPLFYNRDNNGIPLEWVKYIKNTFAQIAPHFTMKRMLTDYQNKFYCKLAKRTEDFKVNDYDLAVKYASWKRKIYNAWDDIEVISLHIPDPSVMTYKVSDEYEMSIELKINELSVDDIAVDVIVGRRENDFHSKVMKILPMFPSTKQGSRVVFSLKTMLHSPGVVDIAIRVHPKNSLMPYPMDVNAMKWI